MKVATLAASAIVAAALGGCGSTASTASPASAVSAVSSAAPATGPSGLPCNPQASSCWLPQAAQAPQEQFLSYRPARSYPSAYALAKVLGCSVMQPEGSYTPSNTAVNCETGPAAGITVSSPGAITNIATNVLNNAGSTGNDAYAVFGPDWVAAGADNAYTNAAQIQDLAGGELVCFSDGVTVDGQAPCSGSSAQPVPTPSVSAGPESCPSAPASYDSAQQEAFSTACADWLNQVQQQIQDEGASSPGQAAADWCNIYDNNNGGGELEPACRAGIAAAGGPPVSAG